MRLRIGLTHRSEHAGRRIQERLSVSIMTIIALISRLVFYASKQMGGNC